MTERVNYKVSRQERLRRLNTAHMQGYVYAIEFSSGTVKVGLSKDWAKRLARHTKDAAVHGITILRSWASPAHVGWAANEQELIKFCVANFGSATSGEEYFAGADYDAVRAFAETLTFQPLTPEMLDERERETEALGEKMRAQMAATGLPFALSTDRPSPEPKHAGLLASLSDEQLADIRRQRDRKEWSDRVRLRREIRAWELSDQGREWATQYGFTTNPDLSVPASARGVR
jgi:hypothetical protein